MRSSASSSGMTAPSSVTAAWTATTSPGSDRAPAVAHALREHAPVARRNRGRHRCRVVRPDGDEQLREVEDDEHGDGDDHDRERANEPANHCCYPSPSRSRGPGVFLPSRGAGIAESSIRRSRMSLTKEVKLEIVEKHGEGSRRHWFGGGAGSPPHETHQRSHRASADASEGSLLAARALEARRPAAAVPRLPLQKGHRGLPRPHQGARPPPVGLRDKRTEGRWKFERVSALVTER